MLDKMKCVSMSSEIGMKKGEMHVLGGRKEIGKDA